VTDSRPSTSARLARTAMGERVAGFIYGTIVVLSVDLAGGLEYPHEPGRIAIVVGLTCVVFWITHVYAHGLGQSVARGERLSFAELRHIARDEASIVEAAVPPVAALMLGAVGILPTHVALWLAFGLGLLVLGAQGLVFARVEHMGTLGTVLVVAANLGLGFLLVLLKLFLIH
jgi:hypothetical protein